MKRNRRLGMIAGVLLSLISAMAQSAERPNVLLIMTDDQGYGDFSLHGNPTLQTPHIDALGKQSVRFERFYVNSFCSPTRAALLTGRYPLRTGVYGVTHGKETMRREELTLAELLKPAGYRTGCFGKWHNGEQFPYTPPGQGFDEFFGFHNGHWNNYFSSELIRGAKFEPTKGYITDVLTDEALAFMRASSGAPFFCYVAYNAPHSPYQVPDRYFDEYKARGLDDTLAAFFGMCACVDENVGRLLKHLDDLKIADNTIVLFLTDNGGTAGARHFNAGMRGQKTSVHEGGCRVPLFVRWPAGIEQPRVATPIASHIDIVPTVLDLCGVTAPANVRFDGKSLRPLLAGADSAWSERTLFTHNPINETNRYPGAVRTQKYRLVRELTGGPQGGSKAKADRPAGAWQLFDMQSDPGQTKDLARELPEVVADLSKQYEAWFDDVSSAGLSRTPIPVGYAEENPVTLHAPQSFFSSSLKFNSGPGYAHDWLTGWNDPKATIRFEANVVQAGDYDVTLRYTCPQADAGSRVRLTIGKATREFVVAAAEPVQIRLPHRDEEGHLRYQNRDWGRLSLGRVSLPSGNVTLKLEPITIAGAQVMDLKGIELARKARGPAEGLGEINPPRKPAAESVMAIVGVRLIDGRGGAPLEDATVIVRGATIVAIGPQSAVRIPDEAKRIDATGMSLLPGLIDSHFHSQHDVIRPVEFELKRGITSFRDPGHPFRFYDEVRAAQAMMPRVFLCGGHLDAHPAVWPDQARVIADADDARRAVNEHVDHGASAIKIYLRLPLEHIAAAAEAAKSRGVLVTAHLELVDADQAIRAGVRGMEHITSFGTALAEEAPVAKFKSAITADSKIRHELRHWLWSTIDLEHSPKVKPLLDLIVRERVFVSPTLAVFEKRTGDKGATEADVAGFRNMVNFTRLCHQAGAKIVVGSHTSAPHAERGRAFQRELELLIEAGLSPREAITAATLTGAQFFGVSQRLGTIEPGKTADLILVAGNPAEDIAALKSVRHIMLNGIWHHEPF